MKLISWNIDSLNAALTSDSARAKLSQDVLQTLVAEDADIIAIQETKLSAKGPTKKHLEVLEELFPGYESLENVLRQFRTRRVTRQRCIEGINVPRD